MAGKKLFQKSLVVFIILVLFATTGCIEGVRNLVDKASGNIHEQETSFHLKEAQVKNANDARVVEESSAKNGTLDEVTILHKCNSCHGLYPMDEFKTQHKEAFADEKLTEIHTLLCAYCHEVEIECVQCHGLSDSILKRGT